MNALSKVSKNNKNLKHQYLWPDCSVCVCARVCVWSKPHTAHCLFDCSCCWDARWGKSRWQRWTSLTSLWVIQTWQRVQICSGHCPATFRSLLGNEIIRLTLKNRWNPRSTLQTWNTSRNVIKARLPAHLISGTAGFKSLHILSCKCSKDLNRVTVWSVVCQMTFYFTLSLC